MQQQQQQRRLAVVYIMYILHIRYTLKTASNEQFFVSGMCVRMHTRNTYGQFYSMKTRTALVGLCAEAAAGAMLCF